MANRAAGVERHPVAELEDGRGFAPVETQRLRLRGLAPADAPFILRLLNEPDFLRFIGDRRVRTLEDARAYIERGPIESYRQTGYGLLLVERKPEATPIGICGVMRKEWLEHPDLAYALLGEAAGRGYATEAAAAALEHARSSAGVRDVVAIVAPDNAGSIRVLEKLGFDRDGSVTDPGTGSALDLYRSACADRPGALTAG